MRKIDWIIWHCTAGPQTQTVKVITDYWKSIGWKKPGYHHIILPDGTIVDLLPIAEVSNGVKGFNANSINICYIGGVEVIKGINDKGKPYNVIGKAIDNRTVAQKTSQLVLASRYSKMFPKAVFRGHRDFSVDKNRDGIIKPNEWMKTCPSFSAREYFKKMGIRIN